MRAANSLAIASHQLGSEIALEKVAGSGGEVANRTFQGCLVVCLEWKGLKSEKSFGLECPV
jgi:hypothetical protein